MSEKKQVLTSVKIDTDLFDKFKIECIKRKFSFQKLSERAIHIYLTNEDFRKQVHNHNNLSLEAKISFLHLNKIKLYERKIWLFTSKREEKNLINLR
jgi:hypothetical protein